MYFIFKNVELCVRAFVKIVKARLIYTFLSRVCRNTMYLGIHVYNVTGLK